MPDEKKFPFDFMKAVENVTNDTAEVRVNVENAGDIGGGTQYADGAAQATPTGTVAMGTDGSNVRAVTTDSDGDLQIDVKGSLPAGTNAIGKLAANSGVDIGDVDITSIAAGDNNIGNVDIASIAAGDNNIGNVDIVSGTITTVSTVTNVSQLGGAAVPIGAGTEAAAIRVTLPTNGTGIVGLAAGTNGIGKLTANSGVDIGDVDVTSLPKSIQGPGIPNIDSYAHVAINLTTGTDQLLVSSAANKQIWVYGYQYTCGSAGVTVSFQDEDNTAISGIMPHAQYGGASVAPSGNFSMPIWKLATDKDLEIDITGGDVDGWLAYAIVSV